MADQDSSNGFGLAPAPGQDNTSSSDKQIGTDTPTRLDKATGKVTATGQARPLYGKIIPAGDF